MGALAAFVGSNDQAVDLSSKPEVMLSPVAPRRGSEVEAQVLGSSVLAILRGSDSSLWREGGLAVAFHGALDNPADFSSASSQGEGAASAAAVVGHSVATIGVEATADLLRGAFTVVVSDGSRISVIRDHLGLRPAYLHSSPQGWSVATEAKQLAQAVMKTVEPNLEYLRGLIFGFNGVSPGTPYRGLERAPRASVTVLIPGEPSQSSRYWDPEALVESGDVQDVDAAVDGFRERLAQAVLRSVTGNDAIALSGGLDSTTIAALASGPHRELGGDSPLAVSAIYPDLPSVDESELIRLMADEYGLRLNTFRPTARPLDDLGMWVDLLDGPGSTLSMPEIHEMYALARAGGADRILTGELAEYVYSLRYQTLGHLVWKRRWAGVQAHVAHYRANERTWLSIARELARSLAPGLAVHQWSRRKVRGSRPPWVESTSTMDPKRIPPVGQRWPFLQLQPLGGEYSLVLDDVDVASSVSGIEVRYPLVDRDLWEFCLSLRAEVKFPTPRNKDLLRRAMTDVLPDEIVNRKRMTFFDDSGHRNFSPEDLWRWIDSVEFRFDGIDYGVLQQRLSSGEMSISEIDWAQNVARCHAFLAKWN